MTARKAVPKMTEYQLVELLRARYCHDSGNGPSAVLLPQVRSAAGFDSKRTADALVMQLWPSRGLHLEGFEVKCSRSDTLKELRQPEKAEQIARFCEKWWLVVADESFVKDGELPEPWGLLAVDHSGPVLQLVMVKAAPVRDVPKEVPKTFLASILREADREAMRPTKDALEAARRRGYEQAEQAAARQRTLGVADLEQMRQRVAAFEAATGMRVTTDPADLAVQAQALQLLIGTRGDRWNAILPMVRQLSSHSTKLLAALEEAGLGGTDG